MELKSTINIDASVEDTWRVLGDEFADAGTWMSSLISSRLEGELEKGGVRICEIVGFGPFPAGEIKEKLIDFNPSRHSYSYKVIEGLPSLFRSAQNTWGINSTGKQTCEVHSVALVELSWWALPLKLIIPKLMARDLRTFQTELKYRVEFDRPHPSKLEMLRKLNGSIA